MLATIALFLVGIGLLYFGAERLVQGAALLAEYFQLPKTVVGLTLVALGTSAPELFVNVLAALEGNTDLALANVSGSNLANICLGLGFCGLMGGIAIRRDEFGIDSLVMLGTALLVVCLTISTRNHTLPVWSMIPLTIALAYYCYSLCRRPSVCEVESEPVKGSLSHCIILFVAGILGLFFGGEFVVKTAVSLAERFHIGKDVIALTAVALGTSVPDITATIVAARRKESGIAVGNILGSNISNIVLVLNGTLLACRYSLPTTMQVRCDYLAVGFVSALVCLVAYSSEQLKRTIGCMLILGYVGYLVFRLTVIGSVAVQ